MRLALYAIGGGATVWTFLLGAVPSAPWAIVVFFAVAIAGGVAVEGSPLSLLPRLFLVLYVLPFSVCIWYLVDPEYIWLATPAGTAATYQRDQQLIAEMIVVGGIGLLGLLFGFEWARAVEHRRRSLPGRGGRRPPLPPTVAACLAVCVIGLSWLGALPTSIFKAAYLSEGGEPVSVRMGLAAASLVSYSLLIMLAIDAERESVRSGRRRLKVSLVIGATLYIVVFLQLQRGARTSIGLLVGLAFLYLTSGEARWSREIATKRVKLLLIPTIAVVLTYVTLGAARQQMAMAEEDRRPLEVMKGGFRENTWTSVLLTNLGAAAEYRHKTLTYLQGETYLDYFKSLPPGLVAAMLGLERPLEASRGPNWWYVGISTGGMHIAVVPFKNFGVIGVFLVMALYGRFIGFVDLGVVAGGYWRRLLFAMMATVAFLWFWYGDMNVIRALMMVPIVGLLDRLGSSLVGWPLSRKRLARRGHG